MSEVYDGPERREFADGGTNVPWKYMAMTLMSIFITGGLLFFQGQSHRDDKVEAIERHCSEKVDTINQHFTEKWEGFDRRLTTVEAKMETMLQMLAGIQDMLKRPH